MSTNMGGTIIIGTPVNVMAARAGDSITLTWLRTTADALLEETSSLSTPVIWTACTYAVTGGSTLGVTVPNAGTTFYRLRRTQ